MSGAEFDQLVAQSRTYRRYREDERVGEETLLAMVDTARKMPCANNLQKVRYRVVADEAGCETVFSHLHWAALLRDWDGPEPGERPTGYVVICLPVKLAGARFHLVDVGIAAQTLALAAAERGLGTCMHGSFDASLGEELGLDEQGYAVALVLAVGVPGETVVLEEADAEHGVAYWRDDASVHHVPKLSLDGVLV